MARARIASAIQSKVGALIYGEQFTGKSTLASEFAYYKRPDGKPFRVLFLDAENGSIDDYIPNLEENGVDVRNLYIVYTQSLGEVREYISKVKNNENLYMLDEDGNETDEVVLDADGQPFRADAIVVDGTTILNLSVKQGLTEFSKKRNTVKAKAAGLVGDERLVKIEGSGLELKDYNTINFRGQNLIL
ncbi:MAG: ATP-binding protein, partial [Ruminococcus flavefaciens]|nr:ATP-binding protein [Ruminococcus flavefaciens]